MKLTIRDPSLKTDISALRVALAQLEPCVTNNLKTVLKERAVILDLVGEARRARLLRGIIAEL
jgi:hypothetical protein